MLRNRFLALVALVALVVAFVRSRALFLLAACGVILFFALSNAHVAPVSAVAHNAPVAHVAPKHVAPVAHKHARRVAHCRCTCCK